MKLCTLTGRSEKHQVSLSSLDIHSQAVTIIFKANTYKQSKQTELGMKGKRTQDAQPTSDGGEDHNAADWAQVISGKEGYQREVGGRRLRPLGE